MVDSSFNPHLLENFRFELQRFAATTVTPEHKTILSDGSTITVNFEGNDTNTVTFTYNMSSNSFSEGHSGWFINATRANIVGNNIVIQLDEYNEDFSDSSCIGTITLDTAKNTWTLVNGDSTTDTSNYIFIFNGTTISYDNNNTFTSNFYDEISFTGYTVEIDGKTYIIGVDGEGNLLSLSKNAVNNGQVTLDGINYTISGTTESITYEKVAWTINNGIAKYGTDSNTLITLSGVKTTEGITVANNVVTLTEDNLNDQEVTLTGDGYTVALDKDYSPTTKVAGWSGLTYKSARNTAGYEVSSDSKSITYTKAVDATDLFTLSGVKTTDGITVANNVVTLTESNLNSENVTLTGDAYTLALAKDVDTTKETISEWVTLSSGNVAYLEGGSGNDIITGGKGNDSLWGGSGKDTFIYKSGDGNDVIFGFEDKDTLQVGGLEFTTSYENNIITLKFDDGSIQLRDLTALTFHIDNDTYKIKGSKLVKK